MPIQIRFISFYFLTVSRLLSAAIRNSFLLFVIINLTLINTANADERAYTYSTTIKVLKNRTLDVTETITVNVENIKIRHGIVRYFETTRIDQQNKKVDVNLNIISLRRNGVKEKYHTTKKDNVIQVFFGSKDKLVSKGIQTYTFRYLTTNQLNNYDNKDEFYWNASGNKWSMPIFRVEAIVILPKRVKQKSIKFNAYSGYAGVNKQDYISSFKNNHTIKFALNRKYLIGNGLTIAIAWPSGFINAAPIAVVEKQEKQEKMEQTIIVADSKTIQLDITPSNIKPINPETSDSKSINLALVIPEVIDFKNDIPKSEEIETKTISKPLFDTVKEDVKQSTQAENTDSNNDITIIAQLDSNIDSGIDSNPDTSPDTSAATAATDSKPVEQTTTQQLISAEINTDTISSFQSNIVAIKNYITIKNLNNIVNSLTNSNLLTLLGLILLLSYFLLARLYLKSKNKKLTDRITQQEEISFDSLSPAAIRYINEMGYDDRTFAIAIINIAIKGHIDIVKKENSYNIERRDQSSTEELSTDEELLLNTLMGDNITIKLTSSNHEIIHDAMTQHQTQLEKDHRTKYFVTKGYWFNVGFVFLVMMLISVAYIEFQPVQTLLVFCLVGSFALITYILSYLLLEFVNFYKNYRISAIVDSRLFKVMMETKEAYIFAVVAIEIGLIFLSTLYIDIINIVSITVASFISAIFSNYLISNNCERDNILNKIVNLKESITQAEALHDNTQYDSIQLSQKIMAFDNYLPYTIALGVESEWGDHYSLLFDHKDDDDLIGYSPHWYHDTEWVDNNTTGFCESLSSKFSFSAAAAAKASPEIGFADTETTDKTKH